MFTHVVLFLLKPETKSQLGAAREQLLNMRGQIAGLVDVEVGLDELHSERSFDFALITRHNTRADLDVYQDHPVHREVLAFIRPLVERSVAVDYGQQAS